jgi:hypothetical protein
MDYLSLLLKIQKLLSSSDFVYQQLNYHQQKYFLDKVLKDTSEDLVKNIIATAQKDLNGVTAAFDGWTNVRSEHLFGVIFITSEGKSLTWGAKDISSERSKTSNVISHIKDIMEQVHKYQINIKCFVSDSAGEYAAARYIWLFYYFDE